MKSSVQDVLLKRKLLIWASENLRSANIAVADSEQKLEAIRVAAFSERRRYECDKADKDLAIKAVTTAIQNLSNERIYILLGSYDPAFFEIGIDDVPQILEKAILDEFVLWLGSLNADGHVLIDISPDNESGEFSMTAFGAWESTVDTVKTYIPEGQEWRDRGGGYRGYHDILPRD